ncbi:hypothetical protein OG345_42045 (plasmid) [Streptomyces sp. NBC_01220]|uniref:hypothetical protein n=1 Tax=Streptomyces sp. NBC_01220 TaxID=2903781 RepID=UPI00352EEDA9|nr:hypothetical protein OG345_42045 [Streptomyces sp. NBC_01220]
MTPHEDLSVSDRAELETLWGLPATEAPPAASRWSPDEQAAHRAALTDGVAGWQIPGEAAERRRAYGRANVKVRRLYRLLLESAAADRTAQDKVARDG